MRFPVNDNANHISKHARARLEQRYKMVVDATVAEDHLAIILAGESKRVSRGRDGLELHQIGYQGKPVMAMFDPKRLIIVTYYPSSFARRP